MTDHQRAVGPPVEPVDCLEKALRADLALEEVDRELVRRAWRLYRLGFTPRAISPSQMAAVGEILRTANSEADALGRLGTWMENQLAKLEARRERGRRAESWLRPAAGGGEEAPAEKDSLGRTLLAWLQEGQFLPEETGPELDRWAALRRFWLHLHALHRYHDEAGEPMRLHALEEEAATPSRAPNETPGGTA